MEDEGRELTEEEIAEMKKIRAYANATSGSTPKRTTYDNYLDWHYMADKGVSKVLFIIGLVTILFAEAATGITGLVTQTYWMIYLAIGLFASTIIGTILRFMPFTKKYNEILDEQKTGFIILGTFMALYINPFGIASLISYLVASDNEKPLNDIKRQHFYFSCENTKEFMDLYNAINDDFEKKEITEEEYNKNISLLTSDLEHYVSNLDERIKSLEIRKSKGLASEMDIQKEREFITQEKHDALFILNPKLLEEKKEEELKKNEEFKKQIPALLEELEALVYQLEEEKIALYKAYKTYYESGIYSIEEYYERFNKLFEK